MGELKIMCAWCKNFISGDPDSNLVSHGICIDCKKRLYSELEQPDDAA